MGRPRIPPELLAMMERGVSVIVASRDAALRPSMMRAMGSSVEGAGRRITVFVSRAQSPQLLRDLAAGAPIAVVFSEPATHHCVQVKATRVLMRDAAAHDGALLARYLASMEREVQRVGFPPHMTRAMLAHRLEDLVAIAFEPQLAFDQTPGPRAGTALVEGAA
ncbi:MAG: hypothetical protein ACXWJM_07855 [Ramlibacter sp.]